MQGASAVAIGPGLGRTEGVKDFVYGIIAGADAPIVIDADALFAVSENLDILHSVKKHAIITPHAGEMSRLTNLSVNEILSDTIQTAVDFAKEFEVVTVLKDARTIVADPSGHVYINTTGNSALSKAGSGDVLTGIITGLLSQGLDGYTAATLGVYLHGKAGELASEEMSRYGVNASDLSKFLPRAMNL